MLIDDFIQVAEEMEKRLLRLGYKDPYGGGRALFYKIKLPDPHTRARINLWLIEEKINNLILIIRRIRDALNLPLQEGSVETKNMRYIMIDIESFLHFSCSILDNIARITPTLYEPKLVGIKSENFEKQRKWFIDNPEKDPVYSEYLSTRTTWFEDLKAHRDYLTHYSPIITFQSTEYTLTFGTRRGDKGLIPNYPVLKYINEKSSELLEFIIFYNNHFGRLGTND